MDDKQKLTAIASIIATGAAGPATVPGPGIVPTPAGPPLAWWRSPGAPLVDPVPPAFDDIPICKRYAAQGRGPSGAVATHPSELEKTLALCDKVGADTQTRAGIEDLVDGTGSADVDSIVFALLTGWSQGGSLGKPSLFIGPKLIADLIREAKASAAGPSGR